MDELTHTITITISGNYPHGNKQHASVSMGGDGGIEHMLDAYRAALVAAGFSVELAKRLELSDDAA